MNLIKRIRQNRFAVDMLSIINSDILAMILNIVASIILARILGPEKRGIVATVLAIPFMVFPLAEMGIRQTAAYFVGKDILDEKKVYETLGGLLIVLSVLGMLATLLIGVFNGLHNRYGWINLILASSYIPFNMIFSAIKGVLIGRRALVTISVSTVVIPITYIILMIPLGLVDTYQVEWAIFAMVCSTAIGAVNILIQFRKFGKLKPRYEADLLKQFLSLGFIYALTIFVASLNYRLDVVILERLSNAEEVGIYSIAVRLAEILWMIPNALSLVNFSYSASANNQLNQSLRTAKMMRIVLLMALIPGTILFFLSTKIITLVYGIDYIKSGAAVQAILPGVWFALVFKMLNSDLAGRGLPKVSLSAYGLGIIVNVVLCLLWIPDHGSVGASWASSVSYFVVAAIMIVRYIQVTKLGLAELLLPRVSDFKFIRNKD